MIDSELKSHLEKIEHELLNIHSASTGGVWRTLWRGCIYGAGYIVGAVLVIIIIGWILNIVGFIPALSQQVAEFRAALQKIGGTVK